MKLSLALAPLLLGMQVARGTDFPPERYPYPFPVERFTPWAYRKSGPVSRLGYTETTWNIATLYTGANPIEEQTYADLTDAQKAALTELGISQESWDCKYCEKASTRATPNAQLFSLLSSQHIFFLLTITFPRLDSSL